MEGNRNVVIILTLPCTVLGHVLRDAVRAVAGSEYAETVSPDGSIFGQRSSSFFKDLDVGITGTWYILDDVEYSEVVIVSRAAPKAGDQRIAHAVREFRNKLEKELQK